MTDRDENWLTDELRAAAPEPPTATDLLSGVAAVRRTRARRRRNGTVIGSVLAAAVVVAGVSVATAGSSPSQDRSVDAADQTEAPDTQPFPDPPDGSKWVGTNGVVVAVPASWLVTEGCGTGTEGVCVKGPGTRNRVAMGSSEEVGPLFSNSGRCATSAPMICVGSTRFEADDVVINVTAQSNDAQAEVDRILDTAMVLPDGWTTVPVGGEDDVSVRIALLEADGFAVDLPLQDADRSHPVTSDPASGSPVREGATITLRQREENPETQELVVTVVNALTFDRGDLPEGPAVWDARSQTVVYFSPTGYPACLTEGVASARDGKVDLLLGGHPEGCGESLNAAVVTMGGLTEAPTELTVTENGETRTVPVTSTPSVVLLTASAPSNGTRNARITGPLNLQGDCVSVGSSVAIWPYGTTVLSESPLRIRVPGAGVFTEGDVVVGAGGFFDTATDGVSTDIPDSCRTTRGATVNPQLD